MHAEQQRVKKQEKIKIKIKKTFPQNANRTAPQSLIFHLPSMSRDISCSQNSEKKGEREREEVLGYDEAAVSLLSSQLGRGADVLNIFSLGPSGPALGWTALGSSETRLRRNSTHAEFLRVIFLNYIR